MRTAFAIVGLTAIALGLVACRHEETRTSHAMHRLQGRLMEQRRRLWDLDVRLGRLTSIESVRARAQDLDLSLVGPDGRPAAAPTAPAETIAGQAVDSHGSGRVEMDLGR